MGMVLDMIDLSGDELFGARSPLFSGRRHGGWSMADGILIAYAVVHASPSGSPFTLFEFFFEAKPINPCPCPLSFLPRAPPFHLP